jgi:lysozyme
MDYVLGLDLNHYREGVPLRQGKRQGVRFLLNKCTEGTSFIDHTYADYKAEAKELGLPFGGYMYWRFIFNAVGQAEHYCKVLGKTDFRPIVDVERINNRKTDGSPIVSVQANRNHLAIVLRTIEDITGVKPMVYTNWATWNEQFGNWDLNGEYELWVANYGRSTPLMPRTFDEWVLWQFTSTYKITGYYRGVDANWFNGNEAQFEQYISDCRKLWSPDVVVPVDEKEKVVTVSIERANGNVELAVLNVGDSLSVKVEEF